MGPGAIIAAAALGVGAGCALMVAAGALDDLRGLSPRLKIAVQVAGALILFATGYRAPARSCCSGRPSLARRR